MESLKNFLSSKFSTVPEDDVVTHYYQDLKSWYGILIILYYTYIAYYCIIKPANLKKGSKILDVGCGVGTLVNQLNLIGYHGIGIDTNKKVIKHSTCPKNCCYVTDSSRLDFPENYFDLIVSRDVLEHIPVSEIDDCINEWDRVCKDIMIHIIAVSERGSRVINDPAHVNVQSEKWWITKFINHGYKVIRRPSKMYFSLFGNRGYFMMIKDNSA